MPDRYIIVRGNIKKGYNEFFGIFDSKEEAEPYIDAMREVLIERDEIDEDDYVAHIAEIKILNG